MELPAAWAHWNVYMAEAVDGQDAFPAFTQHTASDHIIHSGTARWLNLDAAKKKGRQMGASAKCVLTGSATRL